MKHTTIFCIRVERMAQKSNLTRMKMVKKMKILLLCGVLYMLPSYIFSIGATVEIPNKNTEETKVVVETFLNKIGAGYSQNKETDGFSYYYESTLFSPFKYDLYIGRYGYDKTIVRVDAPGRMSYALTDALMQDLGKKSQANKKYSSKSILLGDLLNLISPAFGFFYTNTNSPTGERSAMTYSLMYLGIDGIMFWLGSKTFFTHSVDPFDRGLIATTILMGGFRLLTFLPNHLQLIANNRLVGLGYSFRF